MNTALVKPSKIIKDATARVRADQDTIERARSVYTAAIKRAEADYYERLRHILATVTSGDADQPAEPAQQPTA